MNGFETFGQVVFGIAAAGIFAFLVRFVTRASNRAAQEVEEERRRLRQEVLGEDPDNADMVVDDSVALLDDEDAEAQTRFAKLLIEYYAYGLTQARRSFSVSLICSVLGGLVLLTGIGMAILKAETTGDLYAAITASVSGLVMTIIGVLFHRRADLALKHMESQTQSLRQDMKVERDAGQAIWLLREVEDPKLKAHLQAALILKFAAAKLPELGEVLKPASPLVEPSVNGTVPQQQSEGSAS
ncbi:TRADD-N-associated membrane domain-containing protein [Streptomyces sp. enrichment culture]|uniref:TRADD-N-associated membrane domain-containing protein n=1 Tax=Streptomyces sp. enrichment culture TaxID=1795815 RepID=UPI003F54CB55